MASTDELVPGQALVDLVSSRLASDVRTTTVRLHGELPPEPIAPAGLYHQLPWLSVLDLHRLVRIEASELTFETYGPTDAADPGEYVLQSWWIPDALALVADPSRTWIEAQYPVDDVTGPYPDAGPDFCLLTYESLQPGEIAYTDGRGAWISRQGYETYVAKDLLRIRR